MEKFIVLLISVIIIPFLCVKIFTLKDDIDFKYMSNNIIRVKNEESGNIDEIPFEDYIVGVVAGEMPTSFEIEALKAQAVASRSYAMYQIKGRENEDYDVVNTTTNQVYQTEEKLKEKWKDSYVTNINKIKKAVLATSGEYLTYNGEVINALFFSTSVGFTENSEEVFTSSLPYLRSVSSSWDKDSPSFTDSYIFDLSDFYNKLGLEYNSTLNIEITLKSSTGRIRDLKINGIEFKGRDVASKLGLRSNYFDIVLNDKKVTINTKGFGHGVGMSQYGANGMAKEGYTYDKILKYYYKDVEIVKS